MTDFTIWGIGVAASASATVAAVVAYGWYSYLKTRLPLAVRYKHLESKVLDLEGQCQQLVDELERHRQEVKQLLQQKQELDLEIGDARAWLEKNRAELEQVPAKRAEVDAINEKLRTGKETLQQLNDELLQAQAQRLEEAEKAADARRDLERTAKEMTELRSLKNDITAEIKRLEQQQQLLQGRIGTLQLDCKKASDRLESLLSDVAREEKRLEAWREELEVLRADRQAAEQARDDAARKFEALQRDFEHKQNELAALMREHETWTRKVDAFQKAIEPPSLDRRLEDFLRPVLVVDGRHQPRKISGPDGET